MNNAANNQAEVKQLINEKSAELERIDFCMNYKKDQKTRLCWRDDTEVCPEWIDSSIKKDHPLSHIQEAIADNYFEGNFERLRDYAYNAMADILNIIDTGRYL